MADFESKFEKFCIKLQLRDNFAAECNIFKAKHIRNMLQYMWGLEEFHEFIGFISFKTYKKEKVAVRLLNEGRKSYDKRQFGDALKLYNDGILEAKYPTAKCTSGTSTSLVRALSNRSLIFFQRKLYDHCISDARAALSLNYPPDFEEKLLKRILVCHLAKDEFDIAEETYNTYATDETYMSNKMLLDSLKKFMSLFTETKKGNRPKRKETSASDISYREIPEIRNSNTIFPSASDAIRMTVNRQKNRGFIATKDIKPGEAVLQEKAFCSSLSVDCLRTFCSNCMKQVLYAPFPCKTCPNVIFCDETCRDEADKLFHKVECPMISAMKVLKMRTYCCLTLRLLCQVGVGELMKKFKMYEEQCRTLAEKAARYEPGDMSDDIMNMFHLYTNKDRTPPADMMFICATTLLILKLFATQANCKLVPTVANIDVSTLSEKQLNLATCIFIIMLRLSSANSHDIVYAGTNDIIGTGIYLTISLLNHSCDPNIVLNSFGLGMVARASKFIKAGSEVLTCYGDDFYTTSQELRAKNLKENFYLDCSCIACKEGWPTYDLMPHGMILRCPRCSSEFPGLWCLKCKIMADHVKLSNGFYNVSFRTIVMRKHLLLVRSLSKDHSSHPPTKKDIKRAISDIMFINRYSIPPTQLLRNAQTILMRGMRICGYSDIV